MRRPTLVLLVALVSPLLFFATSAQAQSQIAHGQGGTAQHTQTSQAVRLTTCCNDTAANGCDAAVTNRCVAGDWTTYLDARGYSAASVTFLQANIEVGTGNTAAFFNCESPVITEAPTSTTNLFRCRPLNTGVWAAAPFDQVVPGVFFYGAPLGWLVAVMGVDTNWEDSELWLRVSR